VIEHETMVESSPKTIHHKTMFKLTYHQSCLKRCKLIDKSIRCAKNR